MKRFAVACVLVALCCVGVMSQLHASTVLIPSDTNGAAPGGDASPDSAAVANTTVSSDPVYCFGASSVTFYISGTGAGTDTLISAQYSNDEGSHWNAMIGANNVATLGNYPICYNQAAGVALNAGPKPYSIDFSLADGATYAAPSVCHYEAIRIQTKAGYVAPGAHTIRWAAVYPRSNWDQSTQPVPTR